MTAPVSFTTTDHALAHKTLQRWRSGALRVLSAKVETLRTPTGTMVVPLVTAAPRTDVTDLVRRHQPELDGDGDCAFDWRFLLDSARPHNSRAIVKCTFRNPARCIFALEFSILAALPFLSLTCDRNAMLLTLGGQRGITLADCAVLELHQVVETASIIAAMEAGR